MSTKRLARTIIEGGRSNYSKFDRRQSNRQVRRANRQFNHALLSDPQDGDGNHSPIRRIVFRDHNDRLAAVKRWLASFVGQPWDKVRSGIARTFNTRTIAGQHIVFDHLLPSVKNSGVRDCFRFRYDFEVDRNGVLQFARCGCGAYQNQEKDPLE